ncbi:MAG TPA: WYL domain-containing protein [Actinomycetota bacterium]|nr:WYL domain-containing protein [Actinomycetota bacterium]
MHPLERLLNLVALLLETKRPLTYEEIGTTLGAYDQDDPASAKRQFERDKDTLRQIGIPIEVVSTDAWEVDQAYRIPKERYELPDISFTPDEVAALFVAAHAAGEEGEAAQAFRKLALGAESGMLAALSGQAAPTGIDASGPHLPRIAEGVSGHRRLRFRYRPAEGEEGDREVDAWGLVFRRGAWYLIGGDRDRKEPRAFRLSRITSEVKDIGGGDAPPEGFRAGDHLSAGPWGVGEPDTTARVAFSPKVAWWALAGIPGSRTLETRPDGWTEADVPAAAGESFVSWVLSFGPDAVVLAPDPVRRTVVAALERVRASG